MTESNDDERDNYEYHMDEKAILAIILKAGEAENGTDATLNTLFASCVLLKKHGDFSLEEATNLLQELYEPAGDFLKWMERE